MFLPSNHEFLCRVKINSGTRALDHLPFASGGRGSIRRDSKRTTNGHVIALIHRMNQKLHETTGGRHPRFFKEMVDRDGR